MISTYQVGSISNHAPTENIVAVMTQDAVLEYAMKYIGSDPYMKVWTTTDKDKKKKIWKIERRWSLYAVLE